MAIPDTENLAPLFITDAPDWAEGVEMIVSWPTTINGARSGLEQRTRGRLTPRFSTSFTLAALSAAEYASRRTRAHTEVATAIIVPLWPIQYAFVSKAGQVITLNLTALASDNLITGEWIYITHSSTNTFHLITAVSGATLTVTGGISGGFDGSARVYPCLNGTRMEGKALFEAAHLQSIDEKISIEGL